MKWRVRGRRKYGNTPIGSFPSRKEAARFSELQLLERAGEISGLQRQVTFELPGGIRYIADFVYEERGKRIAEDSKGVQTAVFRLKAKLFRATFREWELRLT